MEKNYSIESEKIILGTIIQDNELMLKAINILGENDFYNSKHKIIFRTMKELYKNNISFDLTILSEKLSNDIKEQVLTLSDLTEISYHTSRGAFDSHLNLVKEKAKREN